MGSQAQPLADQAFGGDLGELLGSLTLPLRHVARTPRWIMKYHEVSTSNAKNGSVRLDCYIYNILYIYIAMLGLTVGGGFADLYLVLFAVLSPMANLRMTPFKERLELPKAGVPIRPNVSAGWMRILAEKLKQSRQSSKTLLGIPYISLL